MKSILQFLLATLMCFIPGGLRLSQLNGHQGLAIPLMLLKLLGKIFQLPLHSQGYGQHQKQLYKTYHCC
jgi:hypothetical protein